jgi:putative endonuclease
MKSYYVYIVLCSDASYYTGISNNPDRRVWEHNEGLDTESYTYSRRPVTLVFSAVFNNVLEAIEAEKRIKGWSRKKKEALINNDFDLIKELAKCKNDTSHTNFKPEMSFNSLQEQSGTLGKKE